MAKKRVLLVGGDGVSLFAPTGRGIERELTLPWDNPEFSQQLTETLSSQNSGDPVMVLFDGADQTYRKEDNIPKMKRFDRPMYLKRKLEQAFPSYPVRASIEIKPSKKAGGAKGQISYLFVAIPETDKIDKVSESLMASGVPVAGFGLLPAESEGLVTTLSAKLFGQKGQGSSRWAVLIGQHEAGGLRQVVVKDGNLALTRMTPTSEAGTSGAGWAEEVLREFKATLTYIARFGYTAEEGLDVVVICGAAEKHIFNQATLPATNFRCLTVTEALLSIGASGFGMDKNNFADGLHAAWASRKGAMSAPITVPSIQRIMVPRKSAYWVSTAMAVSLLAVSGLCANDYVSYTSLTASIEQKTQQKGVLDREHDEVSKSFDAFPVRPDVVKAALTTKELLDNNTMNVTPILHALRKSLAKDISLKELNIEHMPSAASKLGPEGASATPSKDAKPDVHGTVKISFKFSLPRNLPLEQKVSRSEALVGILQQSFPGYSIKIVNQFGHMSPTGTFQGGGPAQPAGSAPGRPIDDIAEFQMEGAPL